MGYIKTHKQWLEGLLFTFFLIGGMSGYLYWSSFQSAMAYTSPTCQDYQLNYDAESLQPNQNLLQDASVEQIDEKGQPVHWRTNSWGNNTAAFDIYQSGHSGNHALRATVSNYQDGDAKWSFNDEKVTGNTTYIYSDYYMSDAETSLIAQVTMESGELQFVHLTNISPSLTWKKSVISFMAPPNSIKLTIFHVLNSNGYLITDDYQFGPYQLQPLTRGMVSLTFDDGQRDVYTKALPLMIKYGVVSTQYLISDPISKGSQGYYVTPDEVEDFVKQGHEVAGHTATHAALTTLSYDQIEEQMTSSSQYLQKLTKQPIVDFATPYGDYDDRVLAAARHNYCSHRSTDTGYNAVGITDQYHLRVQNVSKDTTLEQIQGWVESAEQQHVWLIFVFHEITDDGRDYSFDPAQFEQTLQYITNKKVYIVTVSQGLQRLHQQQNTVSPSR